MFLQNTGANACSSLENFAKFAKNKIIFAKFPAKIGRGFRENLNTWMIYAKNRWHVVSTSPPPHFKWFKNVPKQQNITHVQYVHFCTV
jgi:hypothetical protein